MKKLALAMCAILLVGLLAACGNGGGSGGASGSAPAASQQYGSNADYKAVIEAARDPELNSLPLFSIVTGPDDNMYDIVFGEGMAFDEQVMEKYALSISTVIIQAYGVAIVLPKQGEAQAVTDQMNAFVEQQKNAMNNYLQDQYEIASSAIVKTVPTGEVVMVMSEGAADVMAKIESGLAQ